MGLLSIFCSFGLGTIPYVRLNFRLSTLSRELDIECSHSREICSQCAHRPSCNEYCYCPCPKCFKTSSQRGIVPRDERSRIVLELLDFTYGQVAWIVKFKTQNEIRQNPDRMKEECCRRINFFINKLDQSKDYFFLSRIQLDWSSETTPEGFIDHIIECKRDLGF